MIETGEIELVPMLNRPVKAEIGLYRVEPGIPEIEVELEKVTLKVDIGMNDEDPTVGGTTENNFDCVVTG